MTTDNAATDSDAGTDDTGADDTGPDAAEVFRGLRMADVRLAHDDGAETVHALDGVSLDVRRGEFVAIVGPSGSGKSSLLAVAGGLSRPDSGTVLVDGSDMTAGSARTRTELRRRHVGYVFQSGNLVPALTALDQLRLPLKLGAVPDARDPLELLAGVGMADKAHRRPDRLSGGERQRVGIARALVTRPGLLLVDEPTAALDRARSAEIVGLLASEAKENDVAVVMVTHDHDVLGGCDRVYEMVDGRLTLQA